LQDTSSGQSGQKDSAESSGGQEASQTSQADQGQGSSQQAQATTDSSGEESVQTDQAADTQASSQPSDTASPQQARDSQAQASTGTSEQSGNRTKESGSSTQGSEHATGSPGSQQQGSQQLAKGRQGAGTPSSASIQGDLLKADIQQLLKELSGELKQLQTALESDNPAQPNPMPGTTTDSQLYDDSVSQLERAAGNRLPVQLEVDTQPTATTRRGSGVGEPSEEVADDLPQQQPEDVTLAAQGALEQGLTRQTIPPEYRPVFERLSDTPQPSSGSSSP
jgi:hypothetical protein